MTTTIVPSIGNSPLMTQAGAGASPGYQAIDVRRMAEQPQLGEGVETYGSFLVTQRGAGANMSVDIGMDSRAWIRGDAVALQSLYPAPPHSATINETITAADATNPRIDQVVLEVLDNTHDASGSNLVRTRVVAGTPTGGATLDNRTGAAATPSSAMLLADVLVGAAASSITNAAIRDRRPFQWGVTPPLLSDLDMVSFVVPLLYQPETNTAVVTTSGGVHSSMQVAALMWLPRRIVGATRIRWKYWQHGGTAITGNYVLGVFDSSGRKIIDTGSVAWTGGLDTLQPRSETITATTFEAGAYFVMFGMGAGTVGNVWITGVKTEIQLGGRGAYPHMPNMILRSATGGITVPTTLLAFTDLYGQTSTVNSPTMPIVALSVG